MWAVVWHRRRKYQHIFITRIGRFGTQNAIPFWGPEYAGLYRFATLSQRQLCIFVCFSWLCAVPMERHRESDQQSIGLLETRSLLRVAKQHFDWGAFESRQVPNHSSVQTGFTSVCWNLLGLHRGHRNRLATAHNDFPAVRRRGPLHTAHQQRPYSAYSHTRARLSIINPSVYRLLDHIQRGALRSDAYCWSEYQYSCTHLESRTLGAGLEGKVII